MERGGAMSQKTYCDICGGEADRMREGLPAMWAMLGKFQVTVDFVYPAREEVPELRVDTCSKCIEKVFHAIKRDDWYVR